MDTEREPKHPFFGGDLTTYYLDRGVVREGEFNPDIRIFGPTGNGFLHSRGRRNARYGAPNTQPWIVGAGLRGEPWGDQGAIMALELAKQSGLIPSDLIITKELVEDFRWSLNQKSVQGRAHPIMKLFFESRLSGQFNPIPENLSAAPKEIQEMWVRRWHGGGGIGARPLLEWVMGSKIKRPWIKITVVQRDEEGPKLMLQAGERVALVEYGEIDGTIGVAHHTLSEKIAAFSLEADYLDHLKTLTRGLMGGWRLRRQISAYNKIRGTLDASWKPVSVGSGGLFGT